MRERIGYHCLVDVKWSGGMEKGGINFLLFCFDLFVYFSIKELSILVTLFQPRHLSSLVSHYLLTFHQLIDFLFKHINSGIVKPLNFLKSVMYMSKVVFVPLNQVPLTKFYPLIFLIHSTTPWNSELHFC